MKPLKYIAYFDLPNSKIERNYVTSASNKLEYIARTIASHGIPVQIISASEVTEKKFRFYSGESKYVSENITLKLEPSFGGSNKFLRIIRLIWSCVYLFIYLILHTKKGEDVIVYHSLGYYHTILWAKYIRRFRLILEVEEIYTDVSQQTNYFRNLEHSMFKNADAFIFSTILLNDLLNKNGKPYVIINGTYQAEPQIVDKFDDGKIHVVYSGTFDIRKGGALAAINATSHLSNNYHMHICGFGSAQDTTLIKDAISITSMTSIATITYEGLLKGLDYIQLLQRCHIGLSTQDPTATFNNTSFPSKILSYMCNGLQVVSIRIPAVENSSVGKFLTYYNNQSPDAIAHAIESVKFTIEPRSIIRNLSEVFSKKIINLLSHK